MGGRTFALGARLGGLVVRTAAQRPAHAAFPRALVSPRFFSMAERSGKEKGWAAAAQPAKKPVSGCGTTPEPPSMVRNMEQKAIDELDDMHVDTVDIEYAGDGPLRWKNPETGEIGGPKGALRSAEPTRYGDWELNGYGPVSCPQLLTAPVVRSSDELVDCCLNLRI